MDVNRTLFELCLAYRVPSAFGERLRPLLERAASSPPKKRERLLALVERSFAEEARREVREPRPAVHLSPEELSVLGTVAEILRTWNPPAWLHVWEQYLRKRE